MKIGIDISQLAYEQTGVANYLFNLVSNLLERDRENDYILFFSSLRKDLRLKIKDLGTSSSVKIKQFKIPLTLLDLLWNKLHILPIEWLIGDVDIFISSDWVEPPVKKAKKATIIYDLVVYKYPLETDKKIIETQMRKLKWVKKESNLIFTISESAKHDIKNILNIEDKKIKVIYPGLL